MNQPQEIVVKKSVLIPILGLIFLLPLLVGAILFLLLSGNLEAILMIFVFGILTVFCLYLLLDRRAILIISQRGIIDNRKNFRFEWSDIKSVNYVKTRFSQTVQLKVTTNHLDNYQDISFDVTGLQLSAQQITEIIIQRIKTNHF